MIKDSRSQTRFDDKDYTGSHSDEIRRHKKSDLWGHCWRVHNRQ